MTTEARPFVPNLTAFGARLALIRWYMGWNQKEAALACGLPAGSWREWELSGRAPRNLTDVADKIHRATGADDYWIITGRATPGTDPGGGGGLLPPGGLRGVNHEYARVIPTLTYSTSGEYLPRLCNLRRLSCHGRH